MPYVIEPAMGVDRAAGGAADAYDEQAARGREARRPAPEAVAGADQGRGHAAAPQPPRAGREARRLASELSRGAGHLRRHRVIGKLYRRQDEIGTPYCVTVDVDSLTDGAATIRERDSMTQERVALDADPSSDP